MTEKLRSRTPSTASTITAERIGHTPSVSKFTRTLDFTRKPIISRELPKVGTTGFIHIDRTPSKKPIVQSRNILMHRGINPIPQREYSSISQQENRVSAKEWKKFNKQSKPLWERKSETASTVPQKNTVTLPNKTADQLQPKPERNHHFRIRNNHRPEIHSRKLKTFDRHAAPSINKPSTTEKTVVPEVARRKNVNVFDRRAFMTQGRLSQQTEINKTIKPAEISITRNPDKKIVTKIKPKLQTAHTRALQANMEQAQLTYNKLRAAQIPETTAKKIITKAVGTKTWMPPTEQKPQVVTKPVAAMGKPTQRSEEKLDTKTNQSEKLHAIQIFMERQRKQSQNTRHVKYWEGTKNRISYAKRAIDSLFSNRKKRFITGRDIAANLPHQHVPLEVKSTVISPTKHDGTYTRNLQDISRSRTRFKTREDAITAVERVIETNPAVTKNPYGSKVRRETVSLAYSGEAPPMYVVAAQALLGYQKNNFQS